MTQPNNNLLLRKRQAVYEAVAKLMPTEGRDYKLAITFGEGTKATVKAIGITPIGIAFAKHCAENLNRVLKEENERSKGTSRNAAKPTANAVRLLDEEHVL